jgi:PIN domain nuclease of toxin-antitoxin system
MRVLLDTSTFLWAVRDPENLSKAAVAKLLDEATVREISVVSVTEIAIKQARGKLTFSHHDVLQGLSDLQARVLPYSAEHAFALFALPDHHADPFDRQIIAQALSEEIPVITSDRAFELYRDLKIIW